VLTYDSSSWWRTPQRVVQGDSFVHSFYFTHTYMSALRNSVNRSLLGRTQPLVGLQTAVA